MSSLWEETSSLPHFDSLNESRKTDVLIIGGGITGILCAYLLQEAGVDYILAEAGSICSGTTHNTTAKITCQHGLIYNKLEKEFSTEYARKYFKANENALKAYKRICKNTECDFEERDNFVYSKSNRQRLEAEMKTLCSIGASAVLTDSVELPFETAGAIQLKGQAQFNPLKFISAIANNLNIFENTMIHSIENGKAISDRGTITADKIIVASHFPFLNKHGMYFMKMYQKRSYVLALENAQQINGMYIDEAEGGFSFRQYDNLLLLGGGGHRTGKSGGGYDKPEAFRRKYYPASKIRFQWAAQDCMTLDSSSYIGRYSKSTPDIYVATGFNKWGMTSAMVSATLLTDMITGRSNEFADIFSPSRTILRPQLAVNSFEAVVNLLSPFPKRCSHLGCALKWNRAEHSWDCPCHGSRFDENGNVKDNPATKNAKL